MSEPQSKSQYWSELAVKAQGGDKAAYAALLRDIVPSIQASLAGKLNSQDAIDDVTQDALMSVHKALHTYSPERPFRPWLMAIVNFRRTDYLRAHYRDKKKMEAVTADGLTRDHAVTNPVLSGELKDMEAALAQLPDKQKSIFVMTRIEGYSMKEAADALGMSESAVKVSAHRATQALQKIIEEGDGI